MADAENDDGFFETEPVFEVALSVEDRIRAMIRRLPVLTKDDVPLDGECPICITPLHDILDELNDPDVTRLVPEDLEFAGVTKLVGCGHIFCTECLVEWICGRHGTCPSCRHVFADLGPSTDSDSSSDGDYVPDDDEEEEEEEEYEEEEGSADSDWMYSDDGMDVAGLENVYVDEEHPPELRAWEERAAGASMNVNADIYMDADLYMDVDAEEDADMENWGLSDGDGSESVSEVEALAMSGGLSSQAEDEDGAEVYSDNGQIADALRAPEDAEGAEPK